MRMLAITPENQAKVDAVVSYAMDHPSFVAGKEFVGGRPGDNPAHVAELDTYRCVFSITRAENRTWRDLSISIPRKGNYPNPYAAYSIAQMFGFTGWNERTVDVPDEWLVHVMQEDNCIRFMQEITTGVTTGGTK